MARSVNMHAPCTGAECALWGAKANHLDSSGKIMAGSKGAKLSAKIYGEKIAVGYMVTDGNKKKSFPFKIKIDGKLVDVVSPDGQTDGRARPGMYDESMVPAVKIYDVSAGWHEVVIEPLGMPEKKQYSFIDYVGALSDPADTAALIIMTPPLMTKAGYALQSPEYSNGSDDAVHAHASVIKAVVREFGDFPIHVVDTNRFFNLKTDVFSDQAHPNCQGHRHLADALMSVKLFADDSIATKSSSKSMIEICRMKDH